MVTGGVSLNQIPGVPVAPMAELALEAERLGYTRCWVCDQGLDCRDIFVTLTAAAHKTHTIRLGTGITHPYTRHPSVTASGIASLDEYSGGRAFVGLGAGGIDTLLPMGLERRKPLTAVKEMIQIFRALGGGQVVNFKGEVFQLHDARIDCARPDLEIWLAGRGNKMLGLGGEMADGVVLDFIHKDLLSEHVRVVRAGAAAAGRNPKLCYSTVIVTNNRALELVRPVMFWRLADAPPDLHEHLGVSPADIEAMREAMLTGGFAAVAPLIKDDWVRPFVLMGSVAECAAELRALVERFQFDEFQLPILEMESAPERMAEAAQVLAAV